MCRRPRTDSRRRPTSKWAHFRWKWMRAREGVRPGFQVGGREVEPGAHTAVKSDTNGKKRDFRNKNESTTKGEIQEVNTQGDQATATYCRGSSLRPNGLASLQSSFSEPLPRANGLASPPAPPPNGLGAASTAPSSPLCWLLKGLACSSFLLVLNGFGSEESAVKGFCSRLLRKGLAVSAVVLPANGLSLQTHTSASV